MRYLLAFTCAGVVLVLLRRRHPRAVPSCPDDHFWWQADPRIDDWRSLYERGRVQ